MVFPRRSAVYVLLVGAVVLFLGPFAWLVETTGGRTTPP